MLGERPSARLTSRERIRRRADFQEAYERGARIPGRLMTLFILPTELSVARLGIAATRKLGGAVRRNRAKRLVREIFRRNRPAPGLDVVIIPRPELLNAPFHQLEAEYSSSLRRRPLVRDRR